MNKIYHLLDEKFVIKLFKKEVLPHYPDFSDIKKIEIIPVKKHIWETTYHAVIEFKTIFLSREGGEKKLSIYCTAHSDEPRKNSYEALKFLWQNNFSKGNLTVPHPLFYSNYFNGFFYRGAKGKNLYYFIRQKDFKEIETIMPRAAAWFAKLHGLPTENAKNFNKENSRIETVIPGINHVLAEIKNAYPQYHKIYKILYREISAQEKKFLSSAKKHQLIHGDAHPENVIKIGSKKIALIDFTDICLSDFARDLGTFLQQLEYMAQRKIGDPAYIEKIKNLFLENYLNNAKIKLDKSLKERIKYYHDWTVLRTATFFLLKDRPEPNRAHSLLKKVCRDYNINCRT